MDKFNHWIAQEMETVYEEIVHSGAISQERLVLLTHIPPIGVAYALRMLEKMDLVVLTGAGLWTTTEEV